jgi:hypothetical protein
MIGQTTMTKGRLTEAAVLYAFVERGFDVFTPFGDGCAFDLLVDLNDACFLRVQCKTARHIDGCAVFNARSTDHGRGRMSYRGRADVIAAYFAHLEKVYVVPVGDRFSGRLRLEPPRNNQRKGIRLASDFELARWSTQTLAECVRGPTPSREPVAQFA